MNEKTLKVNKKSVTDEQSEMPIWFKKEVIEFIKSTKYVKALEIYIPFTKVSAKNQFSKPNWQHDGEKE